MKGQHHDFLVEDKARADERKEIIDVVQDMIENHDKLFEVRAMLLYLRECLIYQEYEPNN